MTPDGTPAFKVGHLKLQDMTISGPSDFNISHRNLVLRFCNDVSCSLIHKIHNRLVSSHIHNNFSLECLEKQCLAKQVFRRQRHTVSGPSQSCNSALEFTRRFPRGSLL